MRTPGFTADNSLRGKYGAYRSFGGASGSRIVIHPAYIGLGGLQQCIKYCGDDSDCIYCCRCLARGGKPEHCCF
jgi:hypothetical protein